MGVRQVVGVAVLVLAGAPGFATEAPDPSEYARVEVRAKLYERAGPLEKPGVRWYEVAAGRQAFRLDLPTRELADLAKGLDGSVVVVVGDLTVETTGDLFSGHKHQAVIRVTGLKRADPPKR
jgi:hypothetical protein